MDAVMDNVKKEALSFEDFSFICRICLKPSDLRPFEGEEYLLDLFEKITKTDVRSSPNFPRSICELCINQLKGILLFMDIRKRDIKSENHCVLKRELESVETVESCTSHEYELKTEETSEDCKKVMSFEVSQICRLCSSSSDLTSVEGNNVLIQLVQDITSTDVVAGMDSSGGNVVCKSCLGKLQNMSCFISSSLHNDNILKSVVCSNNTVETESFPDMIDYNSSIHNDSKVDEVIDESIALIKTENIFVGDIDQKLAAIETEKDKFVVDHPDLITVVRQNELGEKIFQCNYCVKSFRFHSKLQLHLRIHTGEKPFKCKHCEKSFSENYSLNKHQRLHTGEKPFKCDICKRGFTRLFSLNQHLLIHTGEKPFKCENCDNSFRYKSNLREHSRMHTGEKPFTCDLCAKSFNQQYILKEHLRVHTGEKPFKCDRCEKSFSVNQKLRQHLRTHTGEKPYKCDQCERRFAQQSTLNSHLRIHTGEKPYKCERCERSFRFKLCLELHLRAHTGERPFKCDICQKQFSSRKSLKRHSLVHFRPFQCDRCEEGFSSETKLKRHSRVHANEKLLEGDC